MAESVTEQFLARANEMAQRGFTSEEAVALCRELTAAHYENFPVLSKLLPEPQRTGLCVVYAYARLADDFADEARYQGQRREMLDQWRTMLNEAAEGEHSHPIFHALGALMREHDISARLLARLLDAFERDTHQTRYNTWQELLSYCSDSADPVGRVVLRLFGHRDEELDQMSDAICTGLQLANHWQDLGQDLGRDRIYAPREVMRQFGVTEDMLFDRLPLPNVEAMTQEMVQRTWRLFDQGRPLAMNVSKPLARWIRLVWLGGTSILRKIEERGFDTLTGRPTLSRADKLMLAMRGLLVRRLPRSPL